jgi:hypothetical protein
MSKKPDIPRLTINGEQIDVEIDNGAAITGKVIHEDDECIKMITPENYEITIMGAHISAIWRKVPLREPKQT